MQPLNKTMASFVGGHVGERKHAACVDCVCWQRMLPPNMANPCEECTAKRCNLPSRFELAPDADAKYRRSKQKMVYVIGSLRNPAILDIDKSLQKLLPGWRVFSDWMCAGPHADDAWRDHEKERGVGFLEALKRPAAVNVFEFDKKHLEHAAAVLLVLPAGKSAHLELGWCLGKGKPGYILVDDPERWDVMYQFATGISTSIKEIAIWLQNLK